MSLTGEGVIETLADLHARKRLVGGSQWLRDFVVSVAEWVAGGQAITTEQSKIIIMAAETYKATLIGIHGETPVQAFLSKPAFYKPLRVSTVVPREVRWLGHNRVGFRFKNNQVIVEQIKLLTGTKSGWEPVLRLWVVEVTSYNIEDTMKVIRTHKFDFDSHVEQFLLDCHDARGKPSQVVESQIIVCDNPVLTKWATGSLGGLP